MTRFSDKTSKFTERFAPSLHSFAQKMPLSRKKDPADDDADQSPLRFHSHLDRLHIPIADNTPEQEKCDEVQDRGLFLARQERWDELSEAIRSYDTARAATATGMPMADLLLFGARADVVRAAEHSLLHGRPAKDSDFFSGVEAFEGVLMEDPENYALALIVAHMHIDIGWAWRGARANTDISDINREAFDAHFTRAADILRDFCATGLQSPALCAARCALLPGHSHPASQLVREFEGLIDLDPMNPRHMRSLGNYLLPRWYGDYAQLDLHARRIAARTYENWGAGAYTWVWFDALLVDPNGFGMIEAEYFLEGVYDILRLRKDQHTANLLAAHLFQSWQTARQRYHESGTQPELAATLKHGFEMVVRDHLREVHPLVWGHAEIGFENTAGIISPDRLAQKGRETALYAVAIPFLNSLQTGQTVRFERDGITQINP